MAADKNNPRWKNGNLRKKYRERFKGMGKGCALCKGALGPIHYNEPSDAKHPLSFVIDEIIPISKATLYGYKDKSAAAEDWNNLQPVHYICNQKKGNKLIKTLDELNNKKKKVPMQNELDGEW